MKFAIPFVLSATALASLTWLMANLQPVKLPPGVRAPQECKPLLSSKD